MSSFIRVMLPILFLFLINDSIQPTDPPTVEAYKRKINSMKQSDIRVLLRILNERIEKMLDPDFRETIMCLLKKFITEEIMSIEVEQYMDEFNAKYNEMINILIGVLNKEYKKEMSNAVAQICEICEDRLPLFWKQLTVYESCMKPSIPVKCMTHTFNKLLSRIEIKLIFDNFKRLIVSSVSETIRDELLSIIEADDSHVQSLVKDLNALNRLFHDLIDPHSFFIKLYPDIDQRTYLVLSALSMLPTLENFKSSNTNQFVRKFELKMGGRVSCYHFIRNFVYKAIPEDIKYYYDRLKRLLLQYLDKEIIYLEITGEFPKGYGQKLLDTPDRMPPLPPIPRPNK